MVNWQPPKNRRRHNIYTMPEFLQKQFCCFVSNLFTHSQIFGVPSTSLSQQQYFNQSNFSQRSKEASITFNVISRVFHCGPCQCLSVLVGSISFARAAWQDKSFWEKMFDRFDLTYKKQTGVFISSCCFVSISSNYNERRWERNSVIFLFHTHAPSVSKYNYSLYL